jgi:hypothetical protein
MNAEGSKIFLRRIFVLIAYEWFPIRLLDNQSHPSNPFIHIW